MRLTEGILCQSGVCTLKRFADSIFVLSSDSEVVRVVLRESHDLVARATDEFAAGFPLSGVHILFLHDVVGHSAATVLLVEKSWRFVSHLKLLKNLIFRYISHDQKKVNNEAFLWKYTDHKLYQTGRMT